MESTRKINKSSKRDDKESKITNGRYKDRKELIKCIEVEIVRQKKCPCKREHWGRLKQVRRRREKNWRKTGHGERNQEQ